MKPYSTGPAPTRSYQPTHDANLNALFAALRTQIIRSQELVTPGNGRWDHEQYRESLAAEVKIEAKIIKYVADRERRDAIAS